MSNDVTVQVTITERVSWRDAKPSNAAGKAQTIDKQPSLMPVALTVELEGWS